MYVNEKDLTRFSRSAETSKPKNSRSYKIIIIVLRDLSPFTAIYFTIQVFWDVPLCRWPCIYGPCGKKSHVFIFRFKKPPLLGLLYFWRWRQFAPIKLDSSETTQGEPHTLHSCMNWNSH